MTTRGYTREEAEARLAAQMPVEEKAAKSHYVIDNDGSPEELKAKVRGFVEWLKREIVESSNRRIVECEEEEGNRRIVESCESSNRRM